jgi:hypothetical protein
MMSEICIEYDSDSSGIASDTAFLQYLKIERPALPKVLSFRIRRTPLPYLFTEDTPLAQKRMAFPVSAAWKMFDDNLFPC